MIIAVGMFVCLFPYIDTKHPLISAGWNLTDCGWLHTCASAPAQTHFAVPYLSYSVDLPRVITVYTLHISSKHKDEQNREYR